ncbi:MAG: GGDEF domain-containing response regulator [Acidaminococcaceae bacterium]
MKLRRKLLLIEDLEVDRAIFRNYFSSQYEILEAGSSMEAYTLLQRYADDVALILLNIIMPQEEGFTVLHDMRTLGLSSQIPVVVVAVTDEPEIGVRAFSQGAIELIFKPFDLHIAARRINNAINSFALLHPGYRAVGAGTLTQVAYRQPQVVAASSATRKHGGSKDVFVWDYDLRTKCILQTAGSPKFPNFGRVIKDVPETLIAAGYYHEDDVAKVRELYHKLAQGEHTVSAVVRVRNSDQVEQLLANYRYTFISYTNILDSEGVPYHAAGISRDVTEEKLQSMKGLQFRAALMANSIMSSEVDLTADQVLSITEKGFYVDEQSTATTWTQLITHKILTYAEASDRQRVIAQLTCANLLSAFSAGNTELHLDFRVANGSSSNLVWVTAFAYLLKDIVSEHICCHFYIKDTDTEKRLALAVKQQAEMDVLTDSYNRKALIALVDHQLTSGASGSAHALIILDIDNFKTINDNHGHTCGDLVLTETVKYLKSCFRKEDLIGRLGGDEFIIFMSDVEVRSAIYRKVDEVCDNFCAEAIADGIFPPISCSLGVAIAPQDGSTFAQLYEHADIALYQAKRQGKHRSVVYSS